jgi:Mrp family chromosome partitioning ATPase
VTDTHAPDVAAGDADEPEQLREHFRQLLRYRWLVAAGVAAGLLGGAWLGLSASRSYTAASDIVLRAPTNDPFDPAAGADKTVNMGSERQTALSSSVADAAAKALHLGAGGTKTLQDGLQVTNPPQTLVLHIACTAPSPREAARRTDAVTDAYLRLRTRQWEDVRDTMIKKYKEQLAPLTRQLPKGGAASGAVQAGLLDRITDLDNRISNLDALDMTPGTVIRRATPPDGPGGPGFPLSLGLGAAAGVALGLLAAWVRLVFDPTPRSAAEVARAVRAPVLGVLPRGATGPLLVGGQSDARSAEEYRSIAFRLAYDDRFAGRRRLLVVAPRGSTDAAAAVASNLAASFAETGKDVLLVEADLRTPSLVRRLRETTRPRPQWTLPELPAAATAGPAAAQEKGEWPGASHLAVDAGESGIFALVPGERVRNVPRTLTSPRMTRLIAEADAPGSTVVVLAPPVLAYADALALVDRVDGVLIVCDPRGVHRTDLSRIRELIGGAGGTVLGAVLHSESRRAARPGRRAAKSTADDVPRGTRGPGNGRQRTARTAAAGSNGTTVPQRGARAADR